MAAHYEEGRGQIGLVCTCRNAVTYVYYKIFRFYRTPNANHVGFFVAQAKNWYRDAGLDVTLVSPHRDGYATTPASHISSSSEAIVLAIAPSETVISHHTAPVDKPALQAVAALLQDDLSAIVTLKTSGIDRPCKLDNTRYASYAARYEGRIVQEMIKADGGSGDYEEIVLPMLGLWNTLLKDETIQSTWVFMNWEGVEAELKGVELNTFKLGDYGIKYGYSPVLLAHRDEVSGENDPLKAFLNATAEGYKCAATNPCEAANLMNDLVTSLYPELASSFDSNLLGAAVEYSAPHYLHKDSKKWGEMDVAIWDGFLDWLSVTGLLTTYIHSRIPQQGISTTLDKLRQGESGERIPRDSVDSKSMFTNRFLP